MAGRDRLGTLFRLHASALLRYLTARLGTRERAQDVLQEVFLRMHRSGRLEHVDFPQAYLFRIASHVASDKLKREKRDPVSYNTGTIERTSVADVSMEKAIEASSEIDAVLAKLAPLRASILVLRMHEGLSYSEIAVRLGISVHTVKKYLRLSLKQSRPTG